MLWRVEQTMTSRPNTRAKSKITGDQFAEFAATRRSTRDFLPTPIPQDVLDEILRDAMCAPSWSNTKPILVAVASGEKRDRLAAAPHHERPFDGPVGASRHDDRERGDLRPAVYDRER